MVKTIPEIKALFQNGLIPDEDDFEDLIDTLSPFIYAANNSLYGRLNSPSLGTDAIQIGREANAASFRSISIGQSSEAGSPYSIAIGSPAVSNGSNSIAIGKSSSVQVDGIALGPSAVVTGSFGPIAIGKNAVSTYRGISLGVFAESENNKIAIGYQAKATRTVGQGFGGISIGYYAESNEESIAVGYRANSGGSGATNAIGIGFYSNAGNNKSIAIGAYAEATADYAVSIGYQVVNNVANSFKIGVSGSAYLNFSDFTPTAAVYAATHYILVNISGTNFRLLLASV